MTSNVSFLTNCKENFKRRSWATLLLGLFFFIIYIIMPIILVSQLDRPISAENLKYMQSSFRELMGFNYFTGTIMSLFAVLFALHGYSYLFNRRKMDLYLSVPLSTSRRFFSIQVTGIVTFIVLYLVSGSLALLIGLTSDLVTGITISNFFGALLLNILLFISIYELTTIAVMLTGHVIIAVLALLVLSLYELLIRVLHRGYLDIFMDHLIVQDMPDHVFSSPLHPYFNLVDHLNQYNSGLDPKFILSNTLWLSALCLAFFIIAFLLYKKRPNEATDCAISFSKTKPYISIALQLLAGLGGGLFFYTISYDNYFMAVFGFTLGCLLLFFAMNIIFSFDIRSIFKNWKTLIISVAIILIYFFIIVADVFGIDDYIPKAEDIVSCGIDTYGLNPVGYSDENYYYNWKAKDTDENSSCSQMQLTDITPFLALAEIGVETPNWQNYEDDRYRSYTICYHLKNGQSLYRRYSIPDSQALPELEKILTSSEYIASMKDEIDERTEGLDLDPYFYNGFYSEHLSTSSVDEILEAYKKDLNYYSFDENVLDTPIAQWNLFTEYTSFDLPIYENFSYTMDLLNSYNLEDDIKVNVDEIKQIMLYLYPISVDIDDLTTSTGEDDYIDTSSTITISDPEEMKELLDHAISSDFDGFEYNNFSLLQSSGVEYSVDMYVYPKVGSAHEADLQNAHFLYYGDLPEFLAENYYLTY